MIAYLIGKNRISKLVLPKYAVGNYWIKDKENNLVNIEGNGINWQISSTQYARVINSESVVYEENRIYIKNINNIIKKIILTEYETYTFLIGNNNEIYTLYCAPVHENNYTQAEGKKGRELLIGRDDKNQIVYRNNAISKVHAKLSFDNGKWIIENIDRKVGTYVNGSPVNKDIRVLLNGDVIFILGLKIIIMGNSFFIK